MKTNPITQKVPKRKTPNFYIAVLKNLFRLRGGVIFSCFLSVLFTNNVYSSASNTLKNTPSPYLAMHGDDPVHWRAWTNNLFKTAEQDNKLIFVSSGYFACHWCHVMQQESYQDGAVAETLNRHFISVKIDRELHPSIDEAMINFSKEVSGVGGWPQHIILTPSGYPITAFVYQPKKNLIKTLNKLTSLWKSNPKKISALAKLYRVKPTTQPTSLSTVTFRKLIQDTLDQEIDDLSGGLRSTQKFPPLQVLETLLSQSTLSTKYQDWIEITLDEIQNNHLFDHINGGFFRYTIDPNWQTPHFEKMLYTQALLAKIYFIAGRTFKRNDWIHTGNQTIQYVLTDLSQSSGLFSASHSAVDQKGIEGGNYLYSQNDIQTLFASHKHLLTQQVQLEIDKWKAYEVGLHPLPTSEHWTELKSILKSSEKNQTIPVDNKAIIAWNALFVEALIEGHITTQNAQYKTIAAKSLAHLTTLLQKENAPKAIVSNKNRSTNTIGQADVFDHAYTLRALQLWMARLKSKRFTNETARLIDITKKRFLTDTGWKTSQQLQLPFQQNSWHIANSPLPNVSVILSSTIKHSNLSQEMVEDPLRFIEYIKLQ